MVNHVILIKPYELKLSNINIRGEKCGTEGLIVYPRSHSKLPLEPGVKQESGFGVCAVNGKKFLSAIIRHRRGICIGKKKLSSNLNL